MSFRGNFLLTGGGAQKNHPRHKGGRPPRRLRSKIGQSSKGKGERERRFREMEICLEVQQEIDGGQIPRIAPEGISISDVINALESEQWV